MRCELLPNTVATPCALRCIGTVDDGALRQLRRLKFLHIAARADDAKIAHTHMRWDMTADLEYVAVADNLAGYAASYTDPIAVAYL